MGNTSSTASKHGQGGSTTSTTAGGAASLPQVGSGAAGSNNNRSGASSGGQLASGSGGGGGGGLGLGLGAGLTAGLPAGSLTAESKDEGNKALAASLYPQDTRVDNGHLLPLSNVYPTSPQEWLHDVVQKLIIERKLAPFYRGIEDWDGDEYDKDAIDKALDDVGDDQSKNWRKTAYRDSDRRAEAAMYKKTAECPICFLYYPPLINTSRCCDQPICTECFVQIKRAEATTSNLVSEPAACPYCVEPNFGVTYVPPQLHRRTGRGAPKSSPQLSTSNNPYKQQAPKMERSSSFNSTASETDMGPAAKAHARRKSVSHTSADVVTVDAIQADWQAKLAAVQATAARRAARRVVFRQVGDRLMPVGISSGRDINLNNSTVDDQGRLILTGNIPIIGQNTSTEAGSSGFSSSPARLLGVGRSSRRNRGSPNVADGGMDPRMMGMGPDIEELMVMEAMRLSMVDEEERRKKSEKEVKAQAKKEKLRKKPDPAGSGPTTASSSARGSTDVPRLSLDSANRFGFGGGSSSSIDNNNNSTTSGLLHNIPVATSSNSTNHHALRIGGSSKSSFLKMPPMQRNDSSASMTMHNLPPPLMPTQARQNASGIESSSRMFSTEERDDDSLL